MQILRIVYGLVRTLEYPENT